MSRTKHVMVIVVAVMMIVGLGVSGRAQGTGGLPQELAAIRQQLAAIQGSLGTLPVTDIQEALVSITNALAALQQSLANVDPTVSRAISLATGYAYGADEYADEVAHQRRARGRELEPAERADRRLFPLAGGDDPS